MANSKKKLQYAVINFRRENPALHSICSVLISAMSKFITKVGAAEVTVGFEDTQYYEHANS